MTTTNVAQTLAHLVGAEHVAPDDQLARYAVDGVVPQTVVFPADAGQVADVVKLARAEGLALLPWGGGTAMAAGSAPERLDIVLGTRRMGRILEHEPADLVAIVEAGITLAQLNEALGRHGQMLPIDAPRSERATIGGILAANTSGPRRLSYGTSRDHLIGVRFVDAQGELIKGGGKVVKNVAGYDIPKLLVGSLGTLGIIVEATFKLAPAPRASSAILGGFRELDQALEAAQAVLQAGMRPVALDLFNAQAYQVVAARAGVPTLSDRRYFLALDVGTQPATVKRQVDQAHRIITKAGGKSLVVDEGTAYRAFWRAAVDLGRGGERPAPMITRSSMLFSDLASSIHGHEALGESSHLEVGVHVHLAAGVLHGVWWGEANGPADEAMLIDAVATLRKATENLGGRFVVESCGPSVKRAVDVWGPPGPEFAIMRRLKEQFDPGRIFSPGRFVGGL